MSLESSSGAHKHGLQGAQRGDEGATRCVPTSAALVSWSAALVSSSRELHPHLGRGEGVIHSVAWPNVSPPMAKAPSHSILLETQILPVPLGRGGMGGLFWGNLCR